MKKEPAPPSPELWESIKADPLDGVRNAALRDAFLWIITKLSSENKISNIEIWGILNRLKVTKRKQGIPHYYIHRFSYLMLGRHSCRVLLHPSGPDPKVRHYGLFIKE